MSEVDFNTSGRLAGPLTLGLHAIGDVSFAKSVVTDPVTGLPVDYTVAALVKEADSLAISGSVMAADTLFSQDADGYESISLSVTSIGTGNTITCETSDDNQNWYGALGLDASSAGALARATITGTGMYVFSKAGRYFRARVSTYGSGTVSVAGNLHKTPRTAAHLNVASKPRSQDTTALSATNARVQSAATTNATSVKASSGVINHIAVGNNGASAAYLKIYNKASAPTVGTDVPIATLLIPAGSTIAPPIPAGIPCSTGIAYAITGAPADADTTAVLINQVTGFIGYA